MHTLERVTISGFDLNSHLNQEHVKLVIQVGGKSYETCDVRKPSIRPSKTARLGFLIPIKSASQELQSSLDIARDNEEPVTVIIGDWPFSGKVDKMPTRGFHGEHGTFYFALKAEPSTND